VRCTCSDAAACKIFRELSDLRSTTQYRQGNLTLDVGWSETMPWLFYPASSRELFLDEGGVHSKLLLKGGSLESNEVSELTFVAAKYNLTGAYMGLELFTDQLQVRHLSPTVSAACVVGHLGLRCAGCVKDCLVLASHTHEPT
jgi:hypothetical protein